ncbi:MAG: FecR domain-containing protein, partial [Acidobacteria bacterium]|nr:FecR domain-containing protein [Acidobacteriota bacterium]
MQDGPIRGCDDFQALLPDYRAGRLSPPRKLLIEDHLHECVACRNAAEGREAVARTRLAAKPAWRSPWAIAALLAAAAAVSAWFLLRPAGGRITVESLSGAMYKVAQDKVAPVTPGAGVAAGGEVCTGKDSGAVIRLADGSAVEVRERSSFSVSELSGDSTIHLNRGAVIVEAAQHRFGQLRVATPDCSVAAAGAVFGVNAGVKGSRVVVLRGEVRVARGDERKTLQAGEQYATDASMTPVAVRDEIAWSKDLERYVKSLPEPAAVLGHSTRLLALLPAGTAFVASFPNSAGAAGEIRKLVEQQASQSPALREWLRSGRGGDRETSAGIELLQAASAYLGNEIV